MTVILNYLRNARYRRRVIRLNAELGIPADYATNRALSLQFEAARLVAIGPDIYQREQYLTGTAATAWSGMKHSAESEDVIIQVVSAYRSVAYQEGIIRRKLEQGQCIEDILCVSAAPGYSEHHTGLALDLTTPDCPVLEEEFEHSMAFEWLTKNAARFGFRMSYPRNNPHGVVYEPWHWAWRPPADTGSVQGAG